MTTSAVGRQQYAGLFAARRFARGDALSAELFAKGEVILLVNGRRAPLGLRATTADRAGRRGVNTLQVLQDDA